MTDWLRSLGVLSAAFAGVVAVTVGLAAAVAPGRAPAPAGVDGEPTARPSVADLDTAPSALGGTIVVTGDREASMTVDEEAADGQYGLVGDDARIFFGGDPLTVVQLNLDGLSFFPDPDACEITAGRLNPAIGVASAGIRCDEVADIRGNGVVSLRAVLGVAGDMLGLRGDLPPSGGSVTVGDEVLDFAEARLYAFGRPVVVGGYDTDMRLVDGRIALHFSYDPRTHGIALEAVAVDDVPTELDANACSIATREVGRLNPRTAVLDLTLACPAVELPELGTVAIDGSLIVEQVEVAS